MAVVAEPQVLLLVTVMVKITAFPASAATAVYVGATVVALEIVPPPLEVVHKIVPFVAVAPLTVVVPFEQIVVVPPAVAVGNGSTFTVTLPAAETLAAHGVPVVLSALK